MKSSDMASNALYSLFALNIDIISGAGAAILRHVTDKIEKPPC